MCLVEVERHAEADDCVHAPGWRRHGGPHGIAVRWPRRPQGTLEFLLTNHPLDCPVCDKGGECELQDMVFRYGADESRFTEIKHHADEKQWSPVVYFDAPRCILCYRCVRVCDEGLGVKALGVVQSRRIAEDCAQQERPSRIATSAARASTSARSARSPAAAIVIRRGRGR